MEQYLARVQDDIRPGAVKPKIGNDVEFEINSKFMRELRRKLFKGTDDEDAHEHVRRVLEIADLFHFPGVTHDVVMLRVFPITLKGATLRWINRLSSGLATTWDLFEKAFIGQYCPPLKTAKKLKEIRNFKQEVDEPFPSRTHETVCMMGIPEEIHKMKAQEDEGNTNDGERGSSIDALQEFCSCIYLSMRRATLRGVLCFNSTLTHCLKCTVGTLYKTTRGWE
ncbi:RNA-directed DNA polymerase, eukaryota, nucleotide-binding alpha-beta plait domain protein [Tanacetum coccineum]